MAASNQQIGLWDLTTQSQRVEASIFLEKAHEKTINDAKFSPLNSNMIITASDDSHYKIWDVRNLRDKKFVHCYKASEDDLLTATFNNFDENIFATGGESTGMINIWDLRMPKTYINDLNHHK